MFTERLKTLRKNAGLTQKQLADELETSQQIIGYWETGRQKPKYQALSKLAHFFNVSTDYLLGETDVKKSDEIDLSDFELLYRKTSNNLSDEEKAQLEADLKDFLLERERLFKERDEKRKNSL